MCEGVDVAKTGTSCYIWKEAEAEVQGRKAQGLCYLTDQNQKAMGI